MQASVTPVQSKILLAVQSWAYSLAAKTRNKEDLRNFIAMYRLMRQKGYRFPKYKDDQLAVLVQEKSGLMSADEIEKVDKAHLEAVRLALHAYRSFSYLLY